MKKSIIILIAIFIVTFHGLSAQKLVIAHCVSRVNISIDNGKATIVAKDFDDESFSFDTTQLRFTFSDVLPSNDSLFDPSIGSSVKILDVNPGTTMTTDIYAWDSENNHDKCNCEISFVNPKPTGVIYGNIESDSEVSVKMEKINIPYNVENTFVSGENYGFGNIVSGTYKISPFNGGGKYLDGVSTLDMVIVQKHILQLKKFNTLDKYFRADVNNDRKIDVFDVLEIRRLILGKELKFKNNVYRFMRKGLSNDSLEKEFEKGINEYVPVDGDTSQIDFISIKTGDINSSAEDPMKDEETMIELGITKEDLKINFDRTERSGKSLHRNTNDIQTVKIRTPEILTNPGETICVPVIIEDYEELAAAQFALKYDTTKLKFLSIENGQNMDGFQTVSHTKNGEIFILSFAEMNTENNNISLNACFEVIGENGDQTSFDINSSQGFENAFYSITRPLKYEFESGIVKIGDNIEFKFPKVTVGKDEDVCMNLKVKNFKDVTSFILPISWDTDIVKYNRVELSHLPFLNNLDYFYQSDSSELLVIWNSDDGNGKSMLDNSTLLSICFNTIGELNTSSPIEFNSKSGLFEPSVMVGNNPVNASFIDGEILIEDTLELCSIDTFHFIAQPDSCRKTISGYSLDGLAMPGDTILIDGQEEITFGIGQNPTVITVKHIDGSVSKCKTIIDIADTIPPVAVIDTNKTIVLEDNLKVTYGAEYFDGGSYDNCSSVSFEYSPKEFDCYSPNPVEVTLSVSDSYGNVSKDKAFFNIEYPEAPDVMVCNDMVNISVIENQVVEITADMILEGKQTCPYLYSLNLYDSLYSVVPQPDNLIDTSDIGNTYVCKVIHPDGENFCYSTIVINKEKTTVACVKTPRDIPVPDVEILDGYFTDDSGCVDLGVLHAGTVLKPQKASGEDSKSMDVIDLAMIQKYLLGLTNNFTPYQKIAADFNSNGTLSASDILEIRKYILGLHKEESWIFVDASYNLPNYHITDYPDSITFPSENSKYDFIGILKGDVDFSYGVEIDHPQFDFYIEDQVLFKNEPIIISVINENNISNFEGLQYNLYFNTDSIEIQSVNSELAPYMIKPYDDGLFEIVVLNTLFDDIPAGSEIFSLQIKPKKNCVLHEVFTLNQGENYLAYDNHDISSEVITEWKDFIPVSSKDVFLYDDIQIYPVPASDFVYVKFKDNPVYDMEYTITNIVGKVLENSKLVNNRINIKNLTTGLYLVRFYNNQGRSLVKKLVVNR